MFYFPVSLISYRADRTPSPCGIPPSRGHVVAFHRASGRPGDITNVPDHRGPGDGLMLFYFS